MTCGFLFMCAGYYDYDDGYTPDFAGRNSFRGLVVHPQHWPEDLDYEGKRIVVIGSGATAITLIPALVNSGAGHVTMLQRSPTYIGSLPGVDPFAVQGEESLWRRRNEPLPAGDGTEDDRFEPSQWDRVGVEAAIDACRDAGLRDELRAESSLAGRAAAVLLKRSYRRALFASLPPLYRARHERRPRLDLPFRAQDFRGVWLPPHAR